MAHRHPDVKKLFPILLLCLCALSARAYTFVTLTFTNIPTNGCTWILNGTTVRWTNAPLNSTAWIQTNGIAGSATNLVRRLGAQYGFVSAVQTNSTNIIISGGTVQFSIEGNYGFCVTNALANNTNRILLDLPFDYMFDTNRTNAADALMYGLGKYALTSSIPATAKGFTNFVNLAEVQTAGNKTITNSTFSGGTNTGTKITNSTFGGGTLAGTITSVGKIKNGDLTNTAIDRPFLTNASGTLSNVIAHTLTATNFSAPGSGLNSTQIGPGSDASGEDAVAIGLNNIASGLVGVSLGFANESAGDFSVAIGSGNQALGDWSFAGGEVSVAQHDFTFVYGSGIISDYAGQAKFGTDFYITGFMYAGGGYTNALFKGTNIFNSEICLTPRSASGFGNGYNSGFSIATNAYIRISGPSGAYTNSSFTGGYAGLFVFYEADNPASSFVILHRSTIGAPTAAQKVNTTTGGLVNQTNNPATGWLIHNGTEWILGPHSD